MTKILLTVGILAGLALAGTAQGQTIDVPSGADGTSTTAETVTTETTGSFDALSPGNKDIASALYDAALDTQLTLPPDGANLTGLTLEDIAAMNGDGIGWGRIFEHMRAEGYIGADIKNLGQLVSGYKHQRYDVTTGTGIVITNGVGSQVTVRDSKASTGKSRSVAGLAGGSGQGVEYDGKVTEAEGQGFGLGRGGSVATGHGSSTVGVTTVKRHGVGKGSGMGKAMGRSGKVK